LFVNCDLLIDRLLDRRDYCTALSPVSTSSEKKRGVILRGGDFNEFEQILRGRIDKKKM